MVLVTGARGFIGRSLMPRLTAAGYEVKAHTGRINNPLDLRPQLEGVDTVIHLAGAERRGRDRLLRHVDIEGTERLIEECQRAQIQHLLFVSRLGADHNGTHALLRTKGLVEGLIQNSGIPYTILRTAPLYGQEDYFTELIASLAIWSWPLVWMPGGGTIAMQPLWIEDFTRCLVLALGHSGLINRIVELAGEEQLRYRVLVQEILHTIGRRRIPLKIPLVTLRPFTTVLFRWWYLPGVTRYFVDRFFVAELTRHDAVLHHFGFRPVRFRPTITYLNRPGVRMRVFRR